MTCHLTKERLKDGEHTWTLSVLDADKRLIAQSPSLAAYELVGDLVVLLLPLNPVLSGLLESVVSVERG